VTRAFYRSYHGATGKRAGQVTRCHVIREDGVAPGREGWCKTSATDHQNSVAVVLDPMPADCPDGLTWCPLCIGRLAERMGALPLFAAELASITDQPITEGATN